MLQKTAMHVDIPLYPMMHSVHARCVSVEENCYATFSNCYSNSTLCSKVAMQNIESELFPEIISLFAICRYSDSHPSRMHTDRWDFALGMEILSLFASTSCASDGSRESAKCQVRQEACAPRWSNQLHD